MQESPFYEIVLQRGIEQGIEQGEARAKRDAVLKLLASQFGSVPASLAVRINGMESCEALDRLFDAVLNAKTLADVEFPESDYSKVNN